MSASPATAHRIAPYAAEHKDAVIALITGIQRGEFAIPIRIEDQPDLLDVPRYYRIGCGEFWVGLAGQEVAGTLALHDTGIDRDGIRCGSLRKMFVAKAHRGARPAGIDGVARLLLMRLESHAAAHGLRRLYLGTTEAFKAAHRFYEKHGFRPIAPDTLPENFIRLAVDTRFFRRDI